MTAKVLTMPPAGERAVNSWITHLQAAGRSESTVRLRRVYALQALAGRDPWTATVDDFEEWIVAHPEWKPETTRAAIAALRSFYRWAVSRGLRADNPAVDLVQPRQPDGQPHPTPRPIYEEALAKASGRDRLLLRLLATTGLRRAEASMVHSNDLRGDWLTVLGKGGRRRQVPVPPDVARDIRKASGYLFPGAYDGHVAPRWITDQVQRLTGHSAHSLRHLYATTVWNATGDLLALQRLLGHAKAATTERYVLLEADRIAAAAAAAWDAA